MAVRTPANQRVWTTAGEVTETAASSQVVELEFGLGIFFGDLGSDLRRVEDANRIKRPGCL